MQKIKSWPRRSSEWCYPSWNVTHSLQMLTQSSQSEMQQFWGLDGNFTICYRQLSRFLTAMGYFSFSAAGSGWGPLIILAMVVSWRVTTAWRDLEHTSSPRNGNDFLQPAVTAKGCGLQIILCFSGLAGTPELCVSLRCLTPNLHLWVLTGEPEPSSAPTWPHTLQQQTSLLQGPTQTLLPIPLTNLVISIWWRRQRGGSVCAQS